MASHGVPPERGDALLVRGFDPGPEAASEARSVVRQTLLDRDRPELVDTACLLTSELITNALRHASSPVELVIDLTGDRLCVEVIDSSTDAPHVGAVTEVSESATRGRGLLLVDRLADRWGVTRTPPGKSVWFAIRST